MQGIDVSVHQRAISWKAIKAAGISFAYLKATEGVGFTDSSFARHTAEAKKVGIPVGAYHYARPDTHVSAQDPISEADSFVDVVRPARGGLLPALDFEEPGLAPARMLAWATAWLARVHERTGVKPLFYVSPGFWNQHLRGTTPFPDCPLWLAHWGPNDGQPHPAAPIAGWPAVTVHQFTSKGRIAGFAGPVDLNLLPGGALKAITIGGSAATPAPTRVLAESESTLCYPHPAGPGVTIGQGLHETGGIPGNWGLDFDRARRLAGARVLRRDRHPVLRSRPRQRGSYPVTGRVRLVAVPQGPARSHLLPATYLRVAHVRGRRPGHPRAADRNRRALATRPGPLAHPRGRHGASRHSPGKGAHHRDLDRREAGALSSR